MRNKTIFLILWAFSALSIHAMQCTGTLSVQVPSAWKSLYIVVDGQFLPVPNSARTGDWYAFEVSTFGGQYVTNWFLTNTSGNWDSGISKAAWLSKPTNTDYFQCTDMVDNKLFISQNEVTGGTYFGGVPNDAKYFYFLPPADEEWQQGVPMMVVNGGTPVRMETDAERCGWFKAVYDNEPPTDLIIVLNSAPDEYQLGANGVEDEVPVRIDLKARFEALGGNTVFFDADGGSSGWTVDDPGTTGSCGYSLAALVYDSDASMHGAFSCDAYPKVAASSCYKAGVSWPDKSFEEGTIPCMGVKKGVVGSVLDQGKKPMYNAASGCFESAAKFQQLFSETPGVNVKHCVDLNLSRSKTGYWKYDSMEEKDQGFFPLEWEPNSGAGTKRVAYGGMAYGVGNNKQIANSDALAMKVSNWATLDAASGLPFIDLYPIQGGEFDTGDNPNVYDNSSWDTRMGKTGIVGSEAYGSSGMKKNQHFCMESHAVFEYQRGQFLSLRGDDDIWAYIDNRLAIDLGGMHLPAPGLVYLDTMGLVEGTKYDLDIFLCDRRTDMSNLSIKTNLYFNQSQGLFTQEAANDAATLEICKQSGSTSSCDALLSGTSSEVICGDKLASELRYFLTSRRAGDTLWLSDTNKNCAYTDGVLTCYGGVKIGAGKVTVDKSKIQGLAGTYIVWAQLTDPTNPLKVRITKFSADSSASPPSKKITLKAAILKPDTSKCGTDAAHPCLDKLYALFSEPVISLDEAGFSYYSASHKAWGEAWKPVTRTLQDTVATLVFLRYTGIESPQAGDSLRLKPGSWTDQTGNNVQVQEQAVVLRALPGTTPVMPVSQPSVGWRQALSATQGRVWLRDLQGRALWSASLPVSPAQVRAQVALQGRLCLLHIGERAWLVNF